MANNFKGLILVIAVVISYIILTGGVYLLLNSLSPFAKEVNFGMAFIIVLGFYVGAGFSFKKLKLF